MKSKTIKRIMSRTAAVCLSAVMVFSTAAGAGAVADATMIQNYLAEFLFDSNRCGKFFE